MPKPKVILIGGCPGAGKTTLGRAIASRFEYASLTIDDLLNAARAITSPQSHPGLHVMNQPNFVEYYTDSPVDKLIADATLQHEAIWPAVERTIRNHATWGSPIVIDGWHLRPEWAQQIELSGIKACWLVISPQVLEERERQNQEFFSSSDNSKQMFERFLARSLWYNTLIETQAESMGELVLRQDGMQTVDDLCDLVESHFD